VRCGATRKCDGLSGGRPGVKEARRRASGQLARSSPAPCREQIDLVRLTLDFRTARATSARW
jgi:hypothetical protein